MSTDDLGAIGIAKFALFCRAIQQFIDDGITVDAIVAAGNTGHAMARFTELIYEELGQAAPHKLAIPFQHYYPGHENDKSFQFDNHILLPEVASQIQELPTGLRNVLFVDDEIGRGTTLFGVMQLLDEVLQTMKRPRIERYYVIAEDHDFSDRAKTLPTIAFRPYDVIITPFSFRCRLTWRSH